MKDLYSILNFHLNKSDSIGKWWKQASTYTGPLQSLKYTVSTSSV